MAKRTLTELREELADVRAIIMKVRNNKFVSIDGVQITTHSLPALHKDEKMLVKLVNVMQGKSSFSKGLNFNV